MPACKRNARTLTRRAPIAWVMKPKAVSTCALIALLVVFSLLSDSLLSDSARAELLNLGPEQALHPFPDVNPQFVQISYDVSDQLFTAIAYYATVETNGIPGEEWTLDGDGSGYYMILNAYVDSAGDLIGVQALDSFQLWDDAFDANFPYGPASINNDGVPFLEGRVAAFGWQEDDGHRLFEFYISHNTGDATDPGWFGNGMKGMIMDSNDVNAFNGVWDHDWSNSGGGQADVFNVPEPASGVLALVGLAGLLVVGRRLRGFRSWTPRL